MQSSTVILCNDTGLDVEPTKITRQGVNGVRGFRRGRSEVSELPEKTGEASPRPHSIGDMMQAGYAAGVRGEPHSPHASLHHRQWRGRGAWSVPLHDARTPRRRSWRAAASAQPGSEVAPVKVRGVRERGGVSAGAAEHVP